MEKIERADIVAVGIFGASFMALAELLADQVGIPRHRLAVYPGMMATASNEELVQTSARELTPQVIRRLLGDTAPTSPPSATQRRGHGSVAIVESGSLEHIED